MLKAQETSGMIKKYIHKKNYLQRVLHMKREMLPH